MICSTPPTTPKVNFSPSLGHPTGPMEQCRVSGNLSPGGCLDLTFHNKATCSWSQTCVALLLSKVKLICPFPYPKQCVLLFCLYLMCTQTNSVPLCGPSGLCLPLRFGLVVRSLSLSKRFWHKDNTVVHK